MSDGSLQPPAPHLQFGELGAGLEFAACVAQQPLLVARGPRGQGEPVLVLPGFMADDMSTALLRGFLSALGYTVTGWGLGRSVGRMLDYLDRVSNQVETMRETHGRRVRLVGWSRGGVLAREVARDHPEWVERVVTLASPVRGGAKATTIRRLVEQQTGLDAEALKDLMRERNRVPIEVPITAIYSRSDGVVAWQACIDETNPDVEHREVRATHAGIGVNASAFRIVAEVLARSGRPEAG